MKLKVLQLSLLLFAFNSLMAQSESPAKIYLKHYFDMYVPIQKDMWSFSFAVARDKESGVIENKRNELLNTLSHYQNVVAHSPNFNGDSTFRLAVYSWLKTSKSLFQKDYLEIINLKPKAKQSVDDMRTYLKLKEESSSKLQSANEDLDNASELFANNNSLQIIEEETRIGNRIKRINNAFKYYDKIYLLFFEAYVHEAKFNVAVNSQNYNSVKLEVAQLKKVSTTSLEKLDKIKGFEDDPFLKFAAINILTSYQTTASSYGEQVLVYLEITDKVNKNKKEIMAKKPEERTQEDITNYNNLVKERKELIPIFNENTQLFNDSRKREMGEWNAAVEEFISSNALK